MVEEAKFLNFVGIACCLHLSALTLTPSSPYNFPLFWVSIILPYITVSIISHCLFSTWCRHVVSKRSINFDCSFLYRMKFVANISYWAETSARVGWRLMHGLIWTTVWYQSNNTQSLNCVVKECCGFSIAGFQLRVVVMLVSAQKWVFTLVLDPFSQFHGTLLTLPTEE